MLIASIAVGATVAACGATGSKQSSAAPPSDLRPPSGAAPSPTPLFTFSMSRSLPNAPTSTPKELVERAAMEAVIKLAKTGKLERVEGTHLYALPAESSHLSLDGEITISRDADDDLTVIFYVVQPGGPDHYSGWVYRESGKLTSDPNAGGPATVTRLGDHWFWVVAY